MRLKIIATVILTVILTASPHPVLQAKMIYTNDLHPEDGAPTYLKNDTPMYESKDQTGEPVITIDKSTVIRTFDGNSMFYNGKLLYFNPNTAVTGDELSDYVVGHTSEFDKKITTCRKTYLYDSETYNKIATVSADTSFLICDEDEKFYFVNFDGRTALLYKMDALEEIYVKVTTFNDITESLDEILEDLKKVAEKMGLNPASFHYGIESGNTIVNFAKQFIGNPYVWGGTSLTDGCDCSGFTQQVYAHFEIELPRNSSNQATVGSIVDAGDLQPGDLLFFNRGNRIGHVALYAGNDMIIHAKGSQYGIVLEKLHEIPAICRRYLSDLEETDSEK